MPVTYEVVEEPTSELSTAMNDKGFVLSECTRQFGITASDGTGLTDVAVIVGARKTSGTLPFTTLPKTNDKHPTNGYFRVDNCSLSRVSVNTWSASVHYKTPEQTESEDEVSPLNVPADVSFSSITTTEKIDSDINGTPLVNSAGDPFSGITAEISDLTCAISKNISNFDPSSVYTYCNAVNSDTFLGFPAGTAKITSVKATRAVTADTAYFKLAVSVQFRQPFRTSAEEAWYARVQNTGKYVIDDDVGRIPATVGENNKTQTNVEVNLDAAGGRLADGADPIFLTFPRNKTISFSALLGLLN